MSQHHFDTFHEGEKTHVLIGWDRPLHGFFMVIEKESDDDYPYWSNLDLDISHPNTLRPFVDVLKTMKIALPDGLLEAVTRDAEADDDAAVQRIVHY